MRKLEKAKKIFTLKLAKKNGKVYNRKEDYLEVHYETIYERKRG